MPGALALLLVLGGCASMPRGGADADAGGEVSVNINGLPQTVLSGASVENARAQAMALARTRGWTIKRAAANQLLLERPLRTDSPHLAALGANPGPAPVQRVETNLVNGSGGAVVALRTMVVANPGVSGERRVDVTAQSQPEIDASFRSLQQAWAVNRSRIVAPLPLPTQEQVSARAEDLIAKPGGAAGTPAPTPAPAAAPSPSPSPAPAAAVAGPPAAPPAPRPAPAPAPASRPAVASAPAPAARPATAARAAAPVLSTNPALTRTAAPVQSATTIGAGGVGAAPAARNDLVALSGASPRRGLWAYYAEDYAHTQGCTPDDRGAVMLTQTADAEVHEVHCAGGGNFVMSCREGSCQRMP